MKAFLKILMIAVVVAPLVACQKDEPQRGRISVGRTARGPSIYQSGGNGRMPGYNQGSNGQPYSPQNGSVWGAIYNGGHQSNEEFNQKVHYFVSSTMAPEQLGYVSGDLNQDTGVRFWGYVQAAGQFNPNGGNQRMGISQAQSQLRIVIWDEYAGNIDSSGELITEYPVHMTGTASGEIQGNTANIYFQDKYGWIQLNGTFDSQYFYGWVWFDNTNGNANDMGYFFVPTCSFFRCN